MNLQICEDVCLFPLTTGYMSYGMDVVVGKLVVNLYCDSQLERENDWETLIVMLRKEAYPLTVCLFYRTINSLVVMDYCTGIVNIDDALIYMEDAQYVTACFLCERFITMKIMLIYFDLSWEVLAAVFTLITMALQTYAANTYKMPVGWKQNRVAISSDDSLLFSALEIHATSKLSVV